MEWDEAIERYSPMIYSFAKRYHSWARHCGMSFDDLVQAGRIGLFYACRNYDPSRGNFNTCVWHYVQGHIKTSIRNTIGLRTNERYGDREIVSLNARLPWNERATLGDLEESTVDDETWTYVNEFMHHLSHTERVVLRGRMLGMEYKEIANELGITIWAITKALNRIRKKYLAFNPEYVYNEDQRPRRRKRTTERDLTLGEPREESNRGETPFRRVSQR